MESRLTIAEKETTIRLCITRRSSFCLPAPAIHYAHSLYLPSQLTPAQAPSFRAKGWESEWILSLLQKKIYVCIKKVVGNGASLRLRETKGSTWREIRWNVTLPWSGEQAWTLHFHATGWTFILTRLHYLSTNSQTATIKQDYWITSLGPYAWLVIWDLCLKRDCRYHKVGFNLFPIPCLCKEEVDWRIIDGY